MSNLRGGNMRFRNVWLVTVLLCFSAFSFAQETTGTIVGTVKDQSGAVVPKAKVTVTNTDTGVVVRTLTANDKGEYSALLLQIGHYSIAAEASNFKKAVISKLDIHVNENLTFNPNM